MSENHNALALLEQFSRLVDQNVALMRERNPAIANRLETASALPAIPRKKKGAITLFGATAVRKTIWALPFRILAIGDRLTGGRLRDLGDRVTGGGIRAMGKRIGQSLRNLASRRKG
jgi:hypothetical protein